MTETTLEQPEVVGAVIERYKKAFRELSLATAEMCDNTGGECGRDFTATEESIFNALIKQRDELQLVFPSIALDVRYEIQDERRARHKAERDGASDPLAKLLDESPDQVHVLVVENRSGGLASIKAYEDRKAASKESNAWRNSEHHWGSVHSVPVQ